jgi:copper chaperone CopZ
MITATYSISGMTCQHCVSAVTRELLTVDGVRNVEVDLHPGGLSTATVASDDGLEMSAVAAAVDDAGYDLAGDGGI